MIRKYWIIGLVTALLLGTFASTLSTSYFVAYRSLAEEIRKNTLPLTSDNVYSEIQKDLMLPIHISSLMASDTFVRDWVLSGEEDPERIILYLTEIRNRYKMVTSFFVSEITHRYYHPDGILKKVSPDDPQDRWYFRTEENYETYELNIDIDTADHNRMTIFINHRVYGYDNNFIGITGVGLELNKVKQLLNSYREKYKSSVFFVNHSGIVVLHDDSFSFSKNLYDWENFSENLKFILANPEKYLNYEYDDHIYFINSRYIPEFDLFLIILKDNDELHGILKNRLVLNFAAGLFITMIVVGIIFLILKENYLNLEKLASVDTLTGAFNRNAFSLVFSQAVKDALRNESSMSLALMDIDDFKPINDRYGHHYGDQVLKAFSAHVINSTRKSDVLCRWGGEEFVLLLRNCSPADAVQIVETIRKNFSERDMNFGGNLVRITFSAGVVAWREGEDLDRLVDRADKLMYQAKSQGKNQLAYPL